MTIDINKGVELVIELKNKVDFFDIILRIQIDIRHVFNYYEPNEEFIPAREKALIIPFKFPIDVNNFYPREDTYISQGKDNRLIKVDEICKYVNWFISDEKIWGKYLFYDGVINVYQKIKDMMIMNDLKEIEAKILDNYFVIFDPNEGGYKYTLEEVEKLYNERKKLLEEQLYNCLSNDENEILNLITSHELLKDNIKSIFWREY